MALFVTVPQTVHGVFAVENPPPAAITPTGNGNCYIVGQFPWGPSQTPYIASGMSDFYNTFAPRGFSRTGSGHLNVLRKGWPQLGAVRVLGSAAVTSFATLVSVAPANLLTVPAKWPGADANSMTAAASAADNGNSNFFNLTVTISGVSGTSTEIYRNCNISGVGVDVLPDTTNSILIGPCTKLLPGVLTTAVQAFGTGANGSITATSYVGTPGGNDLGFALLEADETVNHCFTDDPGNAIRSAVNAGGMAHVELMTDRVFYTTGPKAQTLALAATDVANYRSPRVVYCDPWCYIYDDTTGAKTLVQSAPWAASVAAQLPASTSIAWKSSYVSALMAGVVDIEATRGSGRGTNTQQGITTLFKSKNGFVFEAGKVTTLTNGQTNLTRTRMGQYMARSLQQSFLGYVDIPNLPFFQQEIVNAADAFLSGLKKAQNDNPAFNIHIVDYAILNIAQANSAASLAQGNFILPIQVQTSSSMERITLSIQYGETVTVLRAA